MTPVRLEPAALGSRVKQSTTEPLRSLHSKIDKIKILMTNEGQTVIGLENQFSVFLRVAVLLRFYCIYNFICVRISLKTQWIETNNINSVYIGSMYPYFFGCQ